SPVEYRATRTPDRASGRHASAPPFRAGLPGSTAAASWATWLSATRVPARGARCRQRAPGEARHHHVATSEISFLHVWVAPERYLQQARLHPRGVHRVHLLGGVPLPGKERSQGVGYREDEEEQVAEGNDVRGLGTVCTVLP